MLLRIQPGSDLCSVVDSDAFRKTNGLREIGFACFPAPKSDSADFEKISSSSWSGMPGVRVGLCNHRFHLPCYVVSVIITTNVRRCVERFKYRVSLHSSRVSLLCIMLSNFLFLHFLEYFTYSSLARMNKASIIISIFQCG